MSFFAVDPVEEAIRANLKKAERLERKAGERIEKDKRRWQRDVKARARAEAFVTECCMFWHSITAESYAMGRYWKTCPTCRNPLIYNPIVKK